MQMGGYQQPHIGQQETTGNLMGCRSNSSWAACSRSDGYAAASEPCSSHSSRSMQHAPDGYATAPDGTTRDQMGMMGQPPACSSLRRYATASGGNASTRHCGYGFTTRTISDGCDDGYGVAARAEASPAAAAAAAAAAVRESESF